MKRTLAFILALMMVLSLCACGGGGNSGYIKINGQQYDLGYLFSLNDLQQEDYPKKDITIVGKIESINGRTTFQYLGDVDSYIRIKSPKGIITVDTSGMEDTIKNWSVGDQVQVDGKISFLTDIHLYIFQWYPTNNSVRISKLG